MNRESRISFGITRNDYYWWVAMDGRLEECEICVIFCMKWERMKGGELFLSKRVGVERILQLKNTLFSILSLSLPLPSLSLPFNCFLFLLFLFIWFVVFLVCESEWIVWECVCVELYVCVRVRGRDLISTHLPFAFIPSPPLFYCLFV